VLKPPSKNPALYEMNTRVRLTELSQALGRRATLDDIPDAELDGLAAAGFDFVWLLGVWQTGEMGRRISRTLPELRASYRQALPDFTEEDICGSSFAIAGYTVSRELGSEDALRRLRERLRNRGVRLVLDFVPNHTAIDHAWVREHPDYYVQGSEQDLRREPINYFFVPGVGILAHGRDPYFPGWSDTLQLNYGNDLLQAAMTDELLKVAGLCDGVRCDMAMLLTPEVFQRTWNISMRRFWPEAIRRVRTAQPGFTFIAEVYWDMEWELQQQGFDYTYDKRLYDRLRNRDAGAVRAHLVAGIDFQRKLVRFLENHDEERAAQVFGPEVERAAAMIAFTLPGMRFFHDGQLEGRRKKVPVHLCRRAVEAPDESLREFCSRLLEYLKMPVLREGAWEMLEASSPDFVAFRWSDAETRVVIVVNYSPRPGAAQVGDRYVELPAWGFDLFTVGA
jgi:glycosidase